MTSTYIIFKDEQIIGYLKEEKQAMNAILTLSNDIVITLRQPGVRVYSEIRDSENKISIYTQEEGRYLDGFVYLKHVLTYRSVEEFPNHP